MVTTCTPSLNPAETQARPLCVLQTAPWKTQPRRKCQWWSLQMRLYSPITRYLLSLCGSGGTLLLIIGFLQTEDYDSDLNQSQYSRLNRNYVRIISHGTLYHNEVKYWINGLLVTKSANNFHYLHGQSILSVWSLDCSDPARALIPASLLISSRYTDSAKEALAWCLQV